MKIEIKEITFDELSYWFANSVSLTGWLEVNPTKSRYNKYTKPDKYLGDSENIVTERVYASIILDNRPLYLEDLSIPHHMKECQLTLKSIKEGLKKLFDTNPESFISFMIGNYDYDDVEKLINYSLIYENC